MNLVDHVYKPRDLPQPVELFNLPIDVVPSDKLRLEHFFKQEAAYYNHLVEGFSTLVRSFPEVIAECNDDWQKVFGHIAETKLNLRPFVDTPPKESELSPFLQLYKHCLYTLTERKIILADLAASPGTLLPVVRRNMAMEMLKFYKEQAAKILTPGSGRSNENGDVYREPPEMLSRVDNDRKRHLQIPKIALKFEWNAIKEATEIRVGYAAHPISVPNVNLLVKSNWNFVVIRQEQGEFALPQTPWVMDVRKVPVAYLVKFFDYKRPRPV